MHFIVFRRWYVLQRVSGYTGHASTEGVGGRVGKTAAAAGVEGQRKGASDTHTAVCHKRNPATSSTLHCAVSVRVPQSLSDERGMASPHSTAASAAKSAAQELVAELAEAKSRIESFVESNEVALQQAVDEHERVMRGLEGARFAWRFTTPIHAAPAPAPGRAHATP